MILHDIFRVVSRFPRYISCYIEESRLLLGQCVSGGKDAFLVICGPIRGTLFERC